MSGHHDEPPKGMMRWIKTTNHKDLGILYMVFGLIMFFVGGAMAMILRAELLQPGMQVVSTNFYNQMLALHGLVMVFGAVMPALAGLANWLIPVMIGASDMALPRINNLGFWILPFAATLLVSTLFMEGGGPNFGWTFYAPLSTTYAPPSTVYFIFAVHMLGVSSVLGGINIIVTILNLRNKKMTLMKMPLFVWSWLITAFLLITAVPVLGGVVTMMLTDIKFGTSFFDAAGGGDPVMFQHIFWFFGHPEVYILILPSFGILSEIIPTFARKRLFGYASMVYAMAAIAFLSFIVWAHHMFTVGMPLAGNLYFMYATILIAVPTGMKIFNWMATVWRSSMTFETPMMWALGTVLMFTIGGLTGLMLGVTPIDTQYHDTYFVVGHFHYTLVSGAIFATFAAATYWMPKWTGKFLDEGLGKLHFWISVLGMNFIFMPQMFVGLAGMPRRIPDYALQFQEWNMLTSIGSFIFGVAQLLFVINLIKSVRSGKDATTPEAWEGTDPQGLEWKMPSPIPYHHDVPEDYEYKTP
ncbi:cytochrome c oxidase subunit I [Magnetococcales bacterium HHB-1]